MIKKPEDHYSETETAMRRDAVVKHMLGKPPKPHSEMKIGRRKSQKDHKRSITSQGENK